MSHVTALPPPPSSGLSGGIDETVEAAQYALSTISHFDSSDVIDATVGVVGVLAIARVVYTFAGRPNLATPLYWVLGFFRRKRA